jgi:hypothetical protein
MFRVVTQAVPYTVHQVGRQRQPEAAVVNLNTGSTQNPLTMSGCLWHAQAKGVVGSSSCSLLLLWHHDTGRPPGGHGG